MKTEWEQTWLLMPFHESESERLCFGVAPHIFQIICFTNVSGKGELWRFEQQWRLCWCDPGLWGWSTGWSSQGDAQLPHFPPVVLQSTTRRCWAAWDQMWSTSWGKTATASQLSSLPSAWLCLTPGVIYKEQPHLQHGARGCQGYHPQPAYIWGLKRASILTTISWSVLHSWSPNSTYLRLDFYLLQTNKT